MAEKKGKGGVGDWDFLVKFGLVGGDGKSSLLARFSDDCFSQSTFPTMGIADCVDFQGCEMQKLIASQELMSN